MTELNTCCCCKIYDALYDSWPFFYICHRGEIVDYVFVAYYLLQEKFSKMQNNCN